MLLSIIDLIEQGEINENLIEPSIKIAETFMKYWSDLDIVTHNPTLHLPFYHLSGDGFWHLHPNKGYEVTLENMSSVKTFTQLKNVIQYAYLDEELFSLLADRRNRHVFRKLIFETYFPEKTDLITEKMYEYPNSFQLFPLIAETKEPYHVIKEKTADEEKRKQSFRNSIMSLYDFTCSMCRRRIITLDGETIVDAAHIVPFRESFNNDVKNGFPLCKNHHWIFDRGLISVDEDYRVLISQKIDASSIITIDLEGRKIMLPKKPQFNPSHEAFDWHQTHIFFQ